jgi:aminopeptidase-like protein
VSWWRRHRDALILTGLGLLLAMSGGYNIYAARISHRNDVVASKVARLTAAQCGETQFLYDFLNALAADTGPHFGSPSDGPPVPGARTKLIGKLHGIERATAPGLRHQGCRVSVPAA